MRIRYTFPVTCEAMFGQGLKFSVENDHFELIVEGDTLIQISVERSGVPSELWPNFIMDPSKRAPHALFVPEAFWEEIEAKLRTMEGALSIWGVRAFLLEKRKVSWLPENEEEARSVHVLEFSSSRDVQRQKAIEGQLVRSMVGADQLIDQELPLAFFRRALIEIEQEREIDAIHEFCFLLECLFANGKFKKWQVVSEMLSNREFVRAIETANRSFERDPDWPDKQSRDEILQRYVTQPTEVIVLRIVELRGQLHHALSTPGGRTWHPSRQRQFRPDAMYLHKLCVEIMVSRVNARLYDPNVVKTFENTEVRTSSGKLVSWVPFGDN